MSWVLVTAKLNGYLLPTITHLTILDDKCIEKSYGERRNGGSLNLEANNPPLYMNCMHFLGQAQKGTFQDLLCG
jgi:hypothetical protein